MNNAPIRVVVILAVVFLTAIIGTQVYLVNQAVSSKQQQFRHSIQIALRNVVESVCEVTGVDVPSRDPIDVISDNYFVVRTNNKIDLEALEYHLRAELQKREINQDFEYGVYDCQSDQMVYGDLVSLSSDDLKPVAAGDLPKLKDYDYYFGVYFPNMTSNIVWGLEAWKFTSAITILVIIFFGYALFVILRQKRLSTIQRDFVNNITHEFKTPISTLKVASSVLVENAEDTRIGKYAGIVKHESERLEKHVNQLLKSAMIEERESVELEIVDFSDLTESVISEPDFQSSGKNIQVDLSTGLRVKANEYLLETCIYNLVDNAVKYGGNEIDVKVYSSNGKGILQVRDNGKGIDPKNQRSVFKKFFRVSEGDKHDVKGFGLGLYVVKTSVHKMGGKVTLDCSDGCMFKIELPLE